MRTLIGSIILALFFFGLYVFGVLQDRMRSKTGATLTSIKWLSRVFGTGELYLSVLLVVFLTVIGAGLVALDALNYLPK